jgi:hypothetical protein
MRIVTWNICMLYTAGLRERPKNCIQTDINKFEIKILKDQSRNRADWEEVQYGGEGLHCAVVTPKKNKKKKKKKKKMLNLKLASLQAFKVVNYSNYSTNLD